MDSRNSKIPRMDDTFHDKKHVLIGCTGSVATIKLPVLISTLLESSQNAVEIKVLVTEHAKHFFKKEEIPHDVKVYCDENEWQAWTNRGDPVLHIDLGKWADLMVIAPLDANTLAKMAQGLCDNLLTCTTRAWDLQKPLLFCPAMNTRMWEHPVTSTHIDSLKSWGYHEVPCVSKTLMCGDTGVGAMAEVPTIVEAVLNKLKL